MEQAEIKALLERYWRAETSLEEEQRLADYFLLAEADPELLPLQNLFQWRQEEAQVKAPADFDIRMLQRISAQELVVPAARISAGVPVSTGKLVYSIRFAAAAAIILCIGLSFLVVLTAPQKVRDAGKAVATVVPGGGDAANGEAVALRSGQVMKDTYSDPRQALAAVRHALLMASARINEGQRITQKNITRLHNSWQAATGD
jgi:hypothetical protein